MDQHRYLPGFSQPLAPSRRRAGYSLSVLLVAGLVVILPGVYAGLVALSLGTLVWHVASWRAWLGSPFNAVTHLLLSGLGLVWSVALIKPLFAPRAHRGYAHKLAAETEPRLHGFVAAVFRTAGLAPPSRIELDHEANASARLGNTLGDLFRGRVTVLTIGLPLVAGLSTGQFAGVLAHECGHFRQQVGMRLSTLIRWIITWFARLVYEQDAWDQWIQRRIERGRCVLCYLMRINVTLTRYVLWCFLTLGRTVASFLLRQMELDADSYEVRLVGCDTFATTVDRMQALAVGHETAVDDMLYAFREGRVTLDFPGLVVRECEQLAEEISRASRAQAFQRTLWLDSHPCDAIRIQRARRYQPGMIYENPQSATELFDHFEQACAQLTVEMNEHLFGPDWQRAEVVSLDAFLDHHNEALDDLFALKRVFGGGFNVARAMYTAPPPVAPTRPSRHAIATLKRSGRILSRRREPFVQRAIALDQWETREASLPLDDVHSRSAPPTWDAEPRDHLADGRERLNGQMTKYEAIFWVWVGATFDVLRSPLAHTLCTNPDEQANELSRMWTAAAQMVEVVPLFQALQHQLAIFEQLMELAQALTSQAAETPSPGEMHRAFEATTHEIASSLSAAQQILNNVIYPFETKPMESIGGYVFEKAPRDEQSPLASAYAFVDRFPDLYARVVGRICHIAEGIEQSLAAGDNREEGSVAR
ncbi:MAG: M48 family metalloprotease [Planctomycetota bacterium]